MPIDLSYASLFEITLCTKEVIGFPIFLLLLFAYRTAYLANVRYTQNLRYYLILYLAFPLLFLVPLAVCEGENAVFLLPGYLFVEAIFLPSALIGYCEMHVRMRKRFLPLSFLLESLTLPIAFLVIFFISLFFDPLD